MKVMANELKDVLSVYNTAPSGNAGEGGESRVFFDEDTIRFFRGEVYFKNEWEFGFKGGVDTDLLTKVAEKYGSDEVEIERNGDMVTVKKGRSVSKLPAMDEDNCPDIDFEDGEWKKIPEDFQNLVESASSQCDESMGEIAKSCIHVHGRFVEASDGLRFGIYKMKGNVADDLFFRKDHAKVIRKFEPTEYMIQDAWVCFKKDEKRFMAVRKLEVPEYPDLNSFYEACKEGETVELPDKIINSLERSGLFLKSEVPIDRFICLKAENGTISITAETKMGRYSDDIECDENLEFKTKVNPSYLLDMMMVSNSITFGDGTISCESKRIKMGASAIE